MPPLQGFAVIMVIATPTLAVEEDWHGQPMLDQPGHLWLIPTLVVAAAFALGGAVGARRASQWWAAAVQGLALGAAAAVIFLAGDIVRRAIRHQAVSSAVLRLWVEAALLSLAISGIGAAIGHLARDRG